MAMTDALTWVEKLASVGLSTAATEVLVVDTDTFSAIWSVGTDQA